MKYITATYSGRLGNVLFEVGSVIGLGKKLGRKPSFKVHPDYTEILSKVLEKYPYVETNEIEYIGNTSENCNYYEFYETPTKSKMLNIVGYLQTPTYFENIKDEIRDLFRPSESLSSSLKSKYIYENLVAVHIRGTDYKAFGTIYEQLGVNYYSRAIKYFKNKNPLSRFVIFTDDETYAKSIISSVLDSEKDFYEFADQSSYKDTEVIHWLGMFKNIIIANSSYSWWGAYLGNAEEVIAPLEWYYTKPPSDWADIYPEGWITISNRDLNINIYYDHPFWNIFKNDSVIETVITDDKNYEKKGSETVFMITDKYLGENLANIDYMLYTKPFSNKYPESFDESKPQVWVGDINTINGYRRLQNTVLTLLKKPELSILLPVYNTPSQYLRTTITSIYKQTFRNWEVLLMDDGSTKLEEFYDRFSWTGILIIRCGTNYKLPTTLNRGIMMSRTDLIARMDSDDIMLKNRLEVQVNFMNSHPNIGVSGCQMNIFSKCESENSPCRFTPIVLGDKDWDSPRCLLAHPSVIYRRNILKKVDYYSEWALHYEDLEMWSKLYKIKEPLVNIPNVLMLYRIHPDSVSRVNNTKQREDSIKLFNNMKNEVIPALRGGKKGIRKYDIEKGN